MYYLKQPEQISSAFILCILENPLRERKVINMNNDFLNNILTVVLIPILPTITAYLIAVLKKKISEVEARVNNDTLKKYIDIAEKIIETSVTSVSQTFVDDLKKNAVFDKAAQSEAFQMAKSKILSALGEGAKLALSEAYGDLGKYIDSRIEFYVRQSKK